MSDDNTRKVTFTLDWFGNKKMISMREVLNLRPETLQSRVSETYKTMILEMESYLVGLPDQYISIHERWPEDWWQAFKERWFPNWWLRRWPVRYKEIDVERQIYKAVCPHVNVPQDATHFRWLAEHDEEGEK